jgi:hypothetical protein
MAGERKTGNAEAPPVSLVRYLRATVELLTKGSRKNQNIEKSG